MPQLEAAKAREKPFFPVQIRVRVGRGAVSREKWRRAQQAKRHTDRLAEIRRADELRYEAKPETLLSKKTTRVP